MRIVFWGSERGCYATSNMLILAVYLACKMGYRITMLELAEEVHGIWDYFSIKEKSYARDYIRTLIKRQLYYVSVDECKGKSEKELVALIKELESNMDMVFLNLANRSDDEAGKLMHNAHLLVLNMKQEWKSFDNFYAYHANLSTRILLLIGNYFETGNCDKEQIQKRYRIPDNQLAVIPNNPEYEMACARGNVGSYIRQSRLTRRQITKRQFYKDVEKAVTQMYEAVHESELY